MPWVFPCPFRMKIKLSPTALLSIVWISRKVVITF
jgi:hypothetical protein